MDSNKNIENSFSDRFNASSLSGDVWNNPSDRVWNKIEKEIFQDKKRRFGLFYFLLSSLSIVALILIGYLLFQNLNPTLNNSESAQFIATINNDMDKVSTSDNSTLIDIEKSSIEESVNNKNLVETEMRDSEILDELDNRISKSKEPKGIDENQVVNEDYIDPNIENVILINKPFKEKKATQSDHNSISENPIEINTSIVLKKESISIAALTRKQLQLVHKRMMNPPKMINLLKESTRSNSFVSFLPNIGSGILNTQGNQKTALSELIDKEYGNSGVGFDLLYTTSISKSFDISMGIGVESSSFSTEYDITLPYTIEDETIEGESGYIDFEHSLPTAFGNTETALRLSRTRATDPLNESDVVFDFNTDHNFVLISVPIGINYKIDARNSSFSLGLKLRPSYVVGASSRIKSVVSHHSAIEVVNNESISSYSDVRNFNLSIGFELGYQILLSKRSGLQLKIGVHDYLFDFYQVNDFSSSIKKAAISIGYFYEL